jgi:hypothetical protein
VDINDYTKADTFSCSLDYRLFPFDPRLIRACGVTIHLQDRGKLFQDNNDLNSIVLDASNTVFVGFVDTNKIQLNETDRTVDLEGRDFTALLIDTPWYGDPIPMTEPIHAIMRRILDSSEQTKAIPIELRLGSEEPILFKHGEDPAVSFNKLPEAAKKDVPTLANLGADLGATAGSKNVAKNDSQWEIIQAMADKSGLICYIDLDKLVLTKPRNLYDRKKSKMFMYGQNLKNLTFERKLGRQKGFNVRVVSLDFATKTLVEALIPEHSSDEWSKSIGIVKKRITVPKPMPPGTEQKKEQPGNTTPGKKETDPKAVVPEGETDAPFMTFKVSDIKDKDHLVRVGEKIFEELGRQQIEGTFETSEMVVFDREGNSFDCTNFNIGTPVEIIIDGLDLSQIKKIDVNQGMRAKALERRGFEPKIAATMSEVIEKIDTPFYTKEVEMNFDQDNGFQLKIGFINFIEIPQAVLK